MNLEVSVFGGTEGESIVIRFPNDTWGVMDGFATPLGQNKHSALSWLKGHSVKKLLFACLTHPHEDHYSGLLDIIREAQPNEFWQSAAITKARLKNILALEESDELAGRDSQGSLADLYQHISKQIRQKVLRPKYLSCSQKMLDPKDTGGVEVWAIGPSGTQQERFERRVGRLFRNGAFDASKAERAVNSISTGLTLIYGKSKIVLGGDIENGGWNDLLDEHSSLAEGACLVKVAHHGSKTSYRDQLWETHRKNTEKTWGLITPYHRHGLPCPRITRQIIDKKVTVFSAGPTKFPTGIEPSDGVIIKDKQRTPTNIPFTGRVTATISDNANVTIKIDGYARELP
jgi:hypothetical protein